MTDPKDDRNSIQKAVAEKDWAKYEGNLVDHDGDHPDYLSLIAGAYNDWIAEDAARWAPDEVNT